MSVCYQSQRTEPSRLLSQEHQSMLRITVRDRVPNKTIRQATSIRHAVETILKLKWNWAGHVAKMTDNRRTKILVDRSPRKDGKETEGDHLLNEQLT